MMNRVSVPHKTEATALGKHTGIELARNFLKHLRVEELMHHVVVQLVSWTEESPRRSIFPYHRDEVLLP